MIKHFKLDTFALDAENVIYVGKIHNEPAIVIVPKKSILTDDFLSIIQNDVELEFKNDIYSLYTSRADLGLNFRLICPATPKYMKKYMSKKEFTSESYEEYLKNRGTEPVQWIQNLLNGVSAENTIYDSNDKFVLIPNYKWSGTSTDDLHLLLIFKDANLRTLRDVTDINLLEEAKNYIIKKLPEFSLEYKDSVLFFHYKPTYDQLHLHITNVNLEGSSSLSVLRARLLEDVIYNLKLDINYYKKDMWYAKKV